MNVNTNYGQVYSGNDSTFSQVSLNAISKEEFFEQIQHSKNDDGSTAVTSEISKEGMKKISDLIESGGKLHIEMTEEQKSEREIKEKAFQGMIQPLNSHKILSSKDLHSYDDFSSIVKTNDPELAKKMDDLMGRIINRQPGETFGKEFIELVGQANKVYQNAINGNGAPIINDYNMMLGATAADYRAERDQKSYYGITQRAEDITKAYASLYSDIVKGYEDGTRKAYAIDEESATGYRLMTMDEELAELDKAFATSKDGVDAMVKDSNKIAAALEKYAEQLAKYKRDVNADEVREEHKKYSKELETMPKDLGDKMKNVIDLFKKDYQDNKVFSMDLVNNLMKANFYIKK